MPVGKAANEHLTIADLSKTWVNQNLDNTVAKYARHWLEFPISSTLGTLILQNSKHGINLGFIMSSILKFSNFKVCGLWSIEGQNMPKNIFNFMIKYTNNTLPTKKNLYKWPHSDSPPCSFCLHPEKLQYVVSSCNMYLADSRYTWCHNSILLFLPRSFSSLQRCLLYADLSCFSSPSLVTGDSLTLNCFRF